MADLTHEPQASSNFSSPFPIDRLHIDIFTFILEIIVDDEAAGFKDSMKEYDTKPVVVVNLSLVCKRWKDIVYNTPSMWPVISIDLMKPSKQAQAKLDRLSRLAMNAPVDLYLWGVHSHEDGSTDRYHWEGDRATCSCREEKIVIPLSNIRNLRSLHADFTSSVASLLFKPAILPSLNRLHTLTLHLGGDFKGKSATFDAKNVLVHTPNLVDLNINNMGTILLDLPEPGNPLLPKLRILQLSASYAHPATPNTLVQFLSHAPNIEILKAFLLNFDKNAPLESFPTIVLPHLRSMQTQGFDPLKDTFSAGKIKTPILEEFDYIHWDNVSNEECRKFFRLNPTIKKLHLGVTDESTYDQALHSAPNVEELQVLGSGYGQWLHSLYSIQLDESTPHPTLICPNLRRLNILIRMRPLEHAFFEELVRIRCAAVDRRGFTEVGCKSVEILEFTVMFPNMIYPELMKSVAWRNAEVTKISKNTYELRWPYSPHSDTNLDHISNN